MSITQKISSFFHRFISYVNTKWLGQTKQLNVDLIPEITRYFLSAAVEDRVRFLARDDQTQADTFRPVVLREYNARMEDGLRVELKQNFPRCPSLVEIEKNLTDCKLPMNLTDELLASPASLWQVLRTRDAFTTRRLRPHEAQVLFGIILRAVQQFTLDIVRVDYPAKGKGTDVPAEAQQIIRKILRRVDEIARLIESPVEVKSAAKAETELRVAVARAKGAACLPLRPIPTSALEHEDLEKHYVGRPDEDALRLARQIRHADGTILVTGYRGVGKSSFVNRVIFHTLEAQKEFPKDGWIVVPVNVNLAKIAGVQNILRLTLRAVREALLESNSREPRRIRARDSSEFGSVRLPLRTEEEIELLEEAYIRATYKVTMSQTNGTERRSDLGSSFSVGANKLVTGVVGVELGKFLEAGVKRTKIEKINRELNLLDYDENAAEQDLAKLIYSLATPRPLYGENGGKNVQIKLVFVFDELDKMDVEKGLKPMIEGLKNLFLQQYSVFILVTSKRFYYDLLKDRAIEDAMLNSYFSAIVHVPLLSFAQARKMVENWVDWDATEQLQTKSPEELKLIEQLTRVLVYRSFGNPRDIIRELRLMQEWADTEQPYLTDRLSKSPALQIFAAIQDCVEKTAVPQQSTSVTSRDSDGSVALVSERLVGDEAKLEQIRRGLYILTEELINRQTLTLDNRKPDSATTESVEQKPTNGSALWQHQLQELLGKITKPPTSSSEPTALAKIQQDNFSLLSVEDVRQLAKRLGGYLSLVHDNPDLFPTGEEWGQRRPLFLMQGVDQLRVTNDFYALTGRQALAANPESHESVSHKMTPEDLRAEAENLAGQASWASQLAAINIISQLPSAKVSSTLEQFLWTVMAGDREASHRLAAAERLTPSGLFKDPNRIALIQTEKDERIRSILIRLLGGASNDESRKLATDTIIQLLKDDAEASARILSDSVAIEALTVLQTVADRDETDTVLKWLINGSKGELVESTTIKVLTTFAEKFQVDTAEKILTTEGVLRFFLQGSNQDLWQQLISPGSRPSETTLKLYLREVFRPRPLEYAAKLLSVDEKIDVDDLLAYLWEVSLENSEELSSVVFTELLNRRDEQTTSGKKRLLDSLRKTREFQNRLLPSLNRALSKAIESGKYKDAEADSLRDTLKELEKQPDPPPLPKPKFNPADLFKRPQSPYNFGNLETTSGRNWNLTVGLIAASAVSVLLAALFYRRGLAADASFGTVLASRFILFFMDAAIAFPFFQFFSTDKGTKKPAEISSSIVGALAPTVLLAIYLHGKYIAPLTFWTQMVQFLVHLPAVFFAYGALWVPVESRSGRYSSESVRL